MPVPPPLRMPWIDKSKCIRALDCEAASHCEKGAFQVQKESETEPGFAEDYPMIDLEMCKLCGDCEHACTENAVKMV
ncbi:MAG: hypothetical protein KKB90_05810 [Actinobacteria bacterium]|nr:hypothetical protein [Actinomycetota bacterium]MCG2818017.1 hypothetical protein [Actinomycetes bacterium]MBU4179483.1 hypothetical protein [Actinomycetota bacterium]MBU4218462.1 hypothetical protein [Actinomycetota bacterium]MBU4358223.1 hypothetical protein [Actinomycetota bacterium]